MKFIALVLEFMRRAGRRCRMYLYRPLFGSHGKNFRFDPCGEYTFATIFVGDDVYLGPRSVLLAAESKITLGNKIMFGPEVMILAGDHNTSVVGQFMTDVHVKRPEDDRDVILEDDVWIGARAIILKGVTIGRGSIVAAGSVVTKSIPPYSVAAGMPAKVLKTRWDAATILRHEAALYPPEKRLNPELLEKCNPAHQ
jgi:acetyltransferase-like isoleucine patch superfamily enzyme